MVQTSSGKWAEKHGRTGATEIHKKGNPPTFDWIWYSDIFGKRYYTGPILYFAITGDQV